MKKRLKIGMDYVVDKHWNPVVVNRAQALQITRKKQDRSLSMFTANVCDCGEYWRGNYGAQKERRGA